MNCEKCGAEVPEKKTLCEKCSEDTNTNIIIEEKDIETEETENNSEIDNSEKEVLSEVDSEANEADDTLNEKKSVNLRDSILPLAVIALISIVLIAVVIFVKDLLSPDSPNATLEKCIEASYNFDIEQYAKHSTINETCRKKLGDTDYNYDEEYKKHSEIFTEFKSYIKENFGLYDVDVRILGNDICKKGEDGFYDYISTYSELCEDDTYIEAFAESEIEIDVEYSINDEAYNESSTESVYSVLVDGVWYFIAD